MEERIVNQSGEQSIYVEKNEGQIYLGSYYVEEPSSAFNNGSYELLDYAATIKPAILREEVRLITDWIEKEASEESSSRLALLYGKAGIGKSVVMHDLLENLRSNAEYLVLGLKSDQIEFVDTDDLSRKIHLAKPLEMVVRDVAQKYKRVILLIDQIDALSKSLSSNRTPLISILKLIAKIQVVPHVRVVISCRPYDLDYDPLLDNLRIKQKWELKEFSKEKVIDILKENHSKERLNDNLLSFLGNPLHLYLFLKVQPEEQQLRNSMSMDSLYHQLWRKYIADDIVRKVEKKRLLALLDVLVSTMYERQELSVHYRTFETEYSSEFQYLFTNELLLHTKNDRVQFFHQTLFDYVYARRFIEKEKNLLDVLKNHHQGLFLRAAVKSILSFLREQNPQKYIRTIEQLIYAKDNNGKDTYRYHLKSLALSNMAYYEIPLKEEINFVSNRVFYDKLYMNVLFETVYSPNWFEVIWKIIGNKGGWKGLSKEYKDMVIQMCYRSLLHSADLVLNILEKTLDFNNEDDCKYLGNLLQRYNLNCSSDKLIFFYNKLVKSRLPLEYVHLLKNILKGNLAFVCNELRENVKQQLREKESQHIHRISISNEIADLYQEILKNHREDGVQLLIDVLNLVYDKTKFEIKGAEIYNSTEFFSFRRVTGGHFMANFVEDAVNILIDVFLNHIEDEKTKRHIFDLAKSLHEGSVFIALYIYTSRADLFKDDVFSIIVKRSVLANAPSWVEYQAVKALEKSFGLWTDEQKKVVIQKILDIDDVGEHILFKDLNEMRLQYGHPLLDIDLHKGKALKVIPVEELRRLSWKAYQECQRIERKFNLARLINEKPSHFSTYSGWTSLSEDQGLKMSREAWLNSMLRYTNDPIEWDKPSLTGQCHLFRDVVSKEPDKFLDLIKEVIHNDKILLNYPQAGMQGLLDAGRIDDAMTVLEGILGAINNDVNTKIRGFNIHSLLFALNDIPKSGHVPEVVFDLYCNTLINAKEPEEDNYQKERGVYDVGINQPRGNAGYMLVECSCEEKYKERIFDTIEQIADTASVYTRGAILLNLAALNVMDKERNVVLFKKLLHDFNPRLMAMPIHNYNPLVYFVNYAVDELMGFFKCAADCPDCYKEQVIILWLAWSHNNRDERIKILLDKMCSDENPVARISLLSFWGGLDERINEDAVEYIIQFMKTESDSQEMGEACDNLFFHAKSWPENVQRLLAEAYVASPANLHRPKAFIEFLAGYAIKDPIQTLNWLEQTLNNVLPDDYHIWNHITDILIQSYNGIKAFNDNIYQETLEKALDMIDAIMQNQNNRSQISNFINKLDNE